MKLAELMFRVGAVGLLLRGYCFGIMLNLSRPLENLRSLGFNIRAVVNMWKETALIRFVV